MQRNDTSKQFHSGARIPAWHVPTEHVVLLLSNRIANAMVRGKQCPVAELALARIQGCKPAGSK